MLSCCRNSKTRIYANGTRD
uniref:Uncharacterized protein n=1 Tax=Rhizophora mucronata TaxID=61149 RepID=A0A2P2NH69_RHIMU